MNAMTPLPVRRPLYYYGWNIVAVCVLAQVAAMALTLNCFSLFLPDWTRELSVPVSKLALSITIFSLGAAIVSPMVGNLADRLPARWLFGGALLGLALFHVAISMVTAGWQIVALYAALLPFAIGFCASIPSQALVSRWFVRRVGLAMGLTAFGLAFAGVVFPPVIVALLPHFGWRGVWLLYAAIIAFVILPIAVLVLRDRPAHDDPFGYVVAHPAAHHASNLRARDILRRRNFWIIVGVFVPVQFISMTVYVNLAPIILSYGFERAAAGGLLSVMSIAALGAKLASGILADRFGNRGPLVIVALVSASGIAMLAVPGSSLTFLTGTMVLIGISGAIWTLVASATAAEFGPQGFGRAFGLVCAFSPIGSLAPPVVARLEELSGSYAAGLVVLAILAVIGAGVAMLLRQPKIDARPVAAASEEKVNIR